MLQVILNFSLSLIHRIMIEKYGKIMTEDYEKLRCEKGMREIINVIFFGIEIPRSENRKFINTKSH